MPNLTRVHGAIAGIHTRLDKRRGVAAKLWRKTGSGNTGVFNPLGADLTSGWEATNAKASRSDDKSFVDFNFSDVENLRSTDLRNATNVSIDGVMYKISRKTPPEPGALTRDWVFQLEPTGEKVPT